MPGHNDSDTRTRAVPRGADRIARLLSGRWPKWGIVAVWLVLIAAVSPMAGQLTDLEENDAAAWLPTNAESLAANELETEIRGSEVLPAVVVYHRDGGLSEQDHAYIANERELLRDAFPQAPPGPVVDAPDGATAMFSMPFPSDEDGTIDAVKALRDTAGGGTNGLDVYVTGPAGFTTDMVAVFDGIDGQLLLAAIVVVTVLLLLIYRSPFLWLVPIVAVAAAHQPASAGVYLAAKHLGVTVNGQNMGILPILVYGVGTNYALLLIARYREALRIHSDTHTAMAVALRRAGPAILASGATSSLGLLCLMWADLASTRSLGPIGAIGIAVVLAAMLTLLPAFLLIAGRRLFWPFIPMPGHEPAQSPEGLWARVGRLVSHRPRTVWIGTTGLLLVLAAGVWQMDTNLAQEDRFRDEPESIAGQRVLGESFPAGSGAPTTLIAASASRAEVERVAAATAGVESITSAAEDDGRVLFDVTLTAPPESAAARDIVADLRERVGGIAGAGALVGGEDATALDIQQANERDRLVVIPIVLAVILVILCLVLRAVVGPVILVATVALSFAAALGASVLAFEHVFGFAAVDPSMLLLGFVFLVTLGIDYNIFMMTRTRQEADIVGTREGAVRGLAATGGVISAAGIVLASTFAVVGILPLVEMAQLGFIVGFGVLLETFVVRPVLVPAVTLDRGDRMWWPGAPGTASATGETTVTSGRTRSPVS